MEGDEEAMVHSRTAFGLLVLGETLHVDLLVLAEEYAALTSDNVVTPPWFGYNFPSHLRPRQNQLRFIRVTVVLF